MRAKQEFYKWANSVKYVTADTALEEAYVAGFKRAVTLVEEILKRSKDIGEYYETENLSEIEGG